MRYRFTFTRHTLGAPGVGRRLRAVHLTDLHLHRGYPPDRLRRLTAGVNALRPDVIVFTGDLIRWAEPWPGAEQQARVLAGMRARLGKYAVRGNHDLRGGGTLAPFLLGVAGFSLLCNQAVPVGGGEAPFWVAGMDDGWYRKARRGFLVRLRQKPGFKLVLCHEPMLARLVPEGGAGLILAGHTHAGQLHLPPAERLWMPALSGRYYHGWYAVRGMPLYVAAGVGESAVSLRVNCPAEVAVFDIWAR